MDRLEAFTCLLYAPNASSTNVNDLRYDIFCAKRGEIESHQLPPCRDCLEKHVQRANYQAAIWRRCLEQNLKVPSPVGRGWKVEKEGVEQLLVHWMDGQPVPQAVLDLLACNCTRKCSLPKCVCLSNGLKRTDMCRLQDCEHQASSFESDDEESADGDIEELTNEYDLYSHIRHYIRLVILNTTRDLFSWTLYDLFSWTLCMTCYLGHYV